MGHCGGVVLVTLALFCFFVSVKGESNFEDDFLFSLAANHDYKDALGKGILFFEGQRSGKLPSCQRVTWRGDSALSDGKPEGVCHLIYTFEHACLNSFFAFIILHFNLD